jgi:hypothetical protein
VSTTIADFVIKAIKTANVAGARATSTATTEYQTRRLAVRPRDHFLTAQHNVVWSASGSFAV